MTRRAIEKICEECSTPFSCTRPEQRFCGLSCRSRAHWKTHEHHGINQAVANSAEAREKKAAKLRGAANPMFGRTGSANPAFATGEYSGVKAYRRQKRNACTDCAATLDLIVHHEDRDRSNNSPENLVTLCRGCHTRRHIAAGDIPGPSFDPSRPRDTLGRFVGASS